MSVFHLLGPLNKIDRIRVTKNRYVTYEVHINHPCVDFFVLKMEIEK